MIISIISDEAHSVEDVRKDDSPKRMQSNCKVSKGHVSGWASD